MSGYEVSKLWGKHHLILRLLALGMAQNEIADTVGVTVATVNNTANSELGQRQLLYLRGILDGQLADVHQNILDTAPIAQEILQGMMLSENTADRLRASIAMDQLDRAGFPAVKQIDSRIISTTLTKEDIDDMKQRWTRERQAAKDNLPNLVPDNEVS